jgi:hypothetical protein
MISKDRLEKALTYLAETDEQLAEARMVMERCEFRAKATKDALIKHGEGGLGERTAAAGFDPEYTAAMDAYFAALMEHDKIRNKRQTESIIVEVWRSLSANRRQGQVI